MSNIVKRSQGGILSNQPPLSKTGKTAVVGGGGALAVIGLAALLPGGVFLWALIMLVAGLFLL